MTDWNELIDDYGKASYYVPIGFSPKLCRKVQDEARTALLSAILEVETERDALKEAMRWIPVEERLPEIHGRYAVLINALGTSLLAVAYYYPAQKCFASIDGEAFPSVTHWIPLPAVPEGDVK